MKGLIALVILVVSASVPADDGWVGNGGSPKLMGSHPTVRMVSEIVRLRVGKRFTHVDCRFVFRNEGPSATIKVGFPDENSTREDDNGTVFESFRSWVDGKPVPTRLEGGGENGVWQVKTVTFPARKTVLVRDAYTVRTGEGFHGGNWGLRYAAYTLHTGASWKGRIGRADIYITFSAGVPAPRRLVDYEALSYKEDQRAADDDPSHLRAWNRMAHKHWHTVFWRGAAKPRLSGRTVVFHLRNLEPTEDDDILLAFAPIIDWSKHLGG